MKTLFERTSSHWVRYSEYEWKAAKDGTLFLTPTRKARPSIYDPLNEYEKIILDAIKIGRMGMSKKPDAEIQNAIREFAINYGLLGFMTALPTTSNFMDYEAVYRKPIYDITVQPEKRNSYTKMAQNELAIQLYSLGLFNPQNVDQALMCLEMMDFEGKDELTGRIARNGTMFEQLQLYKAMAATLAAKYEPELVGGLLNGGPVAENPVRQGAKELPELKRGNEESSHVTKARERAQNVSQVDAGGGKA